MSQLAIEVEHPEVLKIVREGREAGKTQKEIAEECAAKGFPGKWDSFKVSAIVQRNNMGEKGEPKEKRKYTKRNAVNVAKAPAYIDIPMKSEPEPEGKVVVIVVPSNQLKNVLEGLK